MSRNKEKRLRKRQREEKELLGLKVGLVSGITLLVIIVKDALELYINIPWYVTTIGIAIVLSSLFVILAKNRLDGWIKRNTIRVERFGWYASLFAPMIYYLERILYLKIANESNQWVFLTLFGAVLVGAIVLFVRKE